MKSFLTFSVVLLLMGGIAWHAHRALDFPPQNAEIHHVVDIPPESSFKTVTGLLVQKGLLTSPFWFRVLARVQNADRRVKPGEYDLHTHMRPIEILDALVKGHVIQHSVLVPEGVTAHQISQLFSAAGVVDEVNLNRLAFDATFAKSLGIDGPTLEGYLFPDTYFFPRRSKPEDVLKAMVGRLRQVYTPELQARAAELKLTERQVLTLASIIEKETGQQDERPVISAVFHNRLKKHYPLQSDPTVIYDIEGFNGNLTRADLLRPSPYNTYAHPGLPPGPIASPGLKSIQAALNPAPVKYLYFVSRNDGTHEFSATLEEHNRAVNHYQKKLLPRTPRRKAS